MSFFTFAFLIILGIVIFLAWRDSRGSEGIDPELLRATQGNKALAKRLLEQAKFKYPGKSDRWYVEKVIYDIERDHGQTGGRRHRGMQFNARDVREKLFLAGAALWVFNSLIATFDSLFRR